MRFDVVVVGAGPGGSVTAKELAERGASVLLVEKRPEIGTPVRCGEATGIAGLREMGVKPWERAIAAETHGTNLYAPDGTCVELRSKEPNGYVLERRVFDKQLALEAAKAGAEVRVNAYARGLVKTGGRVEGVKIRFLEGEVKVRCSVVVGADGVEGKVARWAGIDTRTRLSQMTSNIQYELAGVELEEPGVMEFYFGARLCPGGYVWVFPKGEDVANVGLGTRDRCRTARWYLERFLREHKALAKGSPVEINAGGVPVQGPVERSVGDGVLLVGDAARHVDPLTGGGIYNAMRCGRIAAETIAGCLDGGEFSEKSLIEYERRWKSEVGSGLLRSLKVKEALERMSDEDLNHVARLMRGMRIGDLDIKELTTAMLQLPPELAEFIQTIM